MNFKYLFILIFSVFITNVNGQASKKEVLFTIDNDSVLVSEFLRVYNKNLDLVQDESQKDLNHYLELFIGYKLKVNKANKLGLQNNPQYRYWLNCEIHKLHTAANTPLNINLPTV